MDQKHLYSYDLIQPTQLRLLRFSQDEHPPSAVLETFSIKAPLPRYRALSYAWTSEKPALAKSCAIQIRKQQLLILNSLQPFIQALRSKGTLLDGSWWWVDSICIDGANIEERAQQVQLMQHIYRQADQVIIWLGEESSESNPAIDFIKFLDKITRQKHSVEEIRTMLQKDRYHPHWIALKNFLSRKWWSRIWTVQEFVLPARASFWCGTHTVGRAAVCRSLSVADKCPSIRIKETLGFRHGFIRRRAWNLYKAGKKPGVDTNRSLLALAAYFGCMNATNDRDRLYGLMALSTDGSLLDVDYSLSSPEVYLRFTQAFIASRKSLDIICFASIYDEPSGSLRPSWVTEWRKRDAFLVIPLMVSQSSNTHIGNLRTHRALEYDTSIRYSASNDRAAVYEFQGSVLLTRGVLIDSVDGLAGSRDFELVQSSEWSPMHLSDCSDSTYSPTETLTSVCKSLVLDRKDRYLRYAMPVAQFLHDFLRLCAPLITASHSSTPAGLQQWFNRT